jgi:hypothetical protein
MLGSLRPVPSPRFNLIPAALALLLASPVFVAEDFLPTLQDIHWGESSSSLLSQFGAQATRLPQPFDFGGSYVDVVVRGVTLSRVPARCFFQMDKATHGLKRVQLEPLGHQINPPTCRAMAATLGSQLGPPDQICVAAPVPAAGFQAAVEEQWQHGDATVSAFFRDTTLQAFEGCLFGPASGWCGLHGQILVRIAPPTQQKLACAPPSRPR